MPPFSGTAYLALDRHPDYMAYVREGLGHYGAHYGGSRRSELAPEVYPLLEAGLARFAGAPAALLASSGTVAGQLASQWAGEPNAELHYAPWTHPALWQPGGKHYRTTSGWSRGITEALARGRRVVALADSVSPLYALQAPWEWLAQAPPDAPLTVVVDDSHAIGVAGEWGQGHWTRLRAAWGGRLLVCASLGKAFSTPGGVIWGEPETLEEIGESARFGSASPPPPAFAWAWLQAEAQGLLSQQHQTLRHNIDAAARRLSALEDFYYLPGFPFFCTPRHELAGWLRRRDILISSFHYPGPADPLITRVVVTAAHNEADLERLEEALLDWKK